LAPHLADQVVATHPGAVLIRTTLDLNLQKNLETLAHDRATALGPGLSMAIMVVDHDSGDVLAHVGSPDYF
ncbi:hypothetical protein, partial [Clostridioides difficile]|uniref:hypothetical protein n=1 Tax=Clostridioides difficile TaxID=1496 RepID=UPI0018DE2AF1